MCGVKSIVLSSAAIFFYYLYKNSFIYSSVFLNNMYNMRISIFIHLVCFYYKGNREKTLQTKVQQINVHILNSIILTEKRNVLTSRIVISSIWLIILNICHHCLFLTRKNDDKRYKVDIVRIKGNNFYLCICIIVNNRRR